MEHTEISIPPFLIIGIAVRTTNAGDQSQKDIGELWQRFTGEQILAKIPDRESDDIYALYLDYENEAHGHYTAIIGCKVHSLEKLPEGFIGKKIPALKYRRYVSKGKIPDAVVATWQYIWESGEPRAFRIDFDLYGPKSQDPQQAEVETYLS
jgi:predicted transcriptional regulator YdeE